MQRKGISTWGRSDWKFDFDFNYLCRFLELSNHHDYH